MEITSGKEQVVDQSLQRDPAPKPGSRSSHLETPPTYPDQTWIRELVADANDQPTSYLRGANAGHDGE